MRIQIPAFTQFFAVKEYGTSFLKYVKSYNLNRSLVDIRTFPQLLMEKNRIYRSVVIVRQLVSKVSW